MINKVRFGEIEGREVSLYILKNYCLEISLSDYGATIVRIRLTLKNGEVRDLVRGYDTLESYMNADGYLGAVVGRVGNRICKGKFSLEGKDYDLYCNNGVNHLHGGKIGFDKKIYDTVIDGDSILFSATSPDGEEGYPGKLDFSVNAAGALISYIADTQKMDLQGGEYLLSFGCTGYRDGEFCVFHRLYDACSITVISSKNTVGFYDMNAKVKIEEQE